MVMGAGEFRRNEQRASAFEQHVASLRDLDTEELHDSFEEHDIIALDVYQRQIGVPGIFREPFSPEFKEQYGDKALLLAKNTALYDEVVEELMDTDEILQNIIQAKHRIEARQSSGQTVTENLEIVTDVLRVRRSVTAYLIELAFVEPNGHNNDDNGGSISQIA